MSRRGRQLSWAIIVISTAFILGYLLKFGRASYAHSAAPPPPLTIAAAAPVASVSLPPPVRVILPSTPAQTTPNTAEVPSDASSAPTEQRPLPETKQPLEPLVVPPTAPPQPVAVQPSRDPGLLPGVAPDKAPPDAPRIKFEKAEYDFGKVYQQDKVTYTYVFENIGKSPLKILNVISTCSCTVGDNATDTVAPEKKGKIPLTFEVGRLRDRVTKHIYVESNDPVEPRVMLTLTGEVKVEADLIPTGVYFRRLDIGERIERSVIVKPVDVKQLKLLEFKSTDPAITLKTPLKQLKPAADGSYTVVFFIGPYPKQQRITTEVTIRTNLKHQTVLTLPVYGRVANDPETPNVPPDPKKLAP